MKRSYKISKRRVAAKLNLPVPEGPLPEARSLSMDDYYRFVLWNLKHTVDLKACREQKKREVVNVRFNLK